jgi:Leucine Rich repeat
MWWLSMRGNNVGGGLRTFASALKLNKSLLFVWLERCSIDNEGAVVLADGLRCNETLTKLFLAENLIANPGAMAILDAMNDRNTTLKLLDLSNNHKISRDLVEALQEVVAANVAKTRLVHAKGNLDLSWRDITPEHIARIVKELSENTMLKKLNLEIDFSKCHSNVVIRSALVANQELPLISIEGRGIGDALTSAIASALHENATVHSLTFTGDGIGHVGAVGLEALTKMLKINSSLIHLGLRVNEVGDAGTVEIADALKINATLTTLDLSGNDICEMGATALFSALNKANRSLTSLNLELNHWISRGLAKSIDDMLVFNYWLKCTQGLKKIVVPWVVHAVQKKRNLWSCKPRRSHRSEAPAGIIFLLVKATATKRGMEGPYYNQASGPLFATTQLRPSLQDTRNH